MPNRCEPLDTNKSVSGLRTERTFGILSDMESSAKVRHRGEALRDHVLDVALELFSVRGYFNTSIHDIRRTAGVSIGAIYHHFQNKEALAKSLYDRAVEQIDSAITTASAGHSGCFARARAIIETLFDLTEREPRTMQFVLLAQHREYLPDEPPICSSQPFLYMRRVVEEGIAAGEVRKIEPWVAASAMYGGALRMMNLKLDQALQGRLADYLDEVADCGWRAIRL